MKKFFSCMIVLAAVAMVSCGGNANSQPAEGEVETVETVVVETAPADSTACAAACDSTACTKAEGECCTK